MLRIKAVIFGAIGTIAETSDIQRECFNQAFADHGLAWQWDQPTYRRLLAINGGQTRLRAYRGEMGADLRSVPDTLIAALHERKTALYAMRLEAGTLMPRPGVAELIAACRIAGVRTALCTSTERSNVTAIQHALHQKLDFADFASITAIDNVAQVKPAPDAYHHCLARLALSAADVVAIEDTPVSMAAAVAAGISVAATPGAMTADQDFSAAALVVPDLAAITLEDLDRLVR